MWLPLGAGRQAASGDCRHLDRGQGRAVVQQTASHLRHRVVHGRPQQTSRHLLNHVFIDELGHDRDGHGSGGGGEDVFDLGVLQANDVLAVDLTDVVVSQHAVTCSRPVLDQGGDLA